MAKTKVLGIDVTKGGKMNAGAGWRLVAQPRKEKERSFPATLLASMNRANFRLVCACV